MENLRVFRNYFGLTQEHLALSLSIDKNSVAYYELGKIIPSIKVLVKIIRFYGISFDFLVEGNNCLYPKNLKLLKSAKELDNAVYSDERSDIESAARSLLGKKHNLEILLKYDNIGIELNDNFHQNLKEMRKLRNLKQAELSEKLGFTSNLLAQYELKSYPPIKRLIELSNLIEISTHALVTGEKLHFQFTDGYFGNTMLLADHFLSLDDHKVLIRLMESALSNKT
jgi:transcriptional regulator with XRE-family HTH domain